MRSLTLSLIIVVVVSLFGLGWALDALFARFNTADKELEVIIAIGENTAVTLNSMSDLAAMNEIVPDTSELSVVTELSDVDEFPMPDTFIQRLIAGEPIVLESDAGLSVHYYLAKHNMVYSIGNIQLSQSSNSLIKILFTSAFYIGTLALVLVWLRPLLRRLSVLRRAAIEYGKGNLNSRVQTTGVSYIADIEKEFNRMAARIQNLIEDNKLLTSSVSHDLRTPLARLRFGVDTLATTKNAEAKDEYLNRISTDLDDMEQQIDSLLRYAGMDNVMDGVEKAPLSLAAISQQCISQYTGERISVTFIAGSGDIDVLVPGANEHIASLINNLLQNAINHANSKVEVSVTSTNDTVSLVVSDDGPGIESERATQFFKPFQRGPESAGYGLGLAIVARIALHHRAFIEVGRCEKLGGAVFTVSFPKT